jgi:signal transduction histidine kinase
MVRLVHDLRTPLTVVSGFAELLVRKRDTLTDEQRDEYIGRIAEGARELRDILDAERAERPL